MSIKANKKAVLGKNFKDLAVEKVQKEIAFQTPLFRISKLKEKIKGKRWYDTEWGYLYLTPRQYLNFLCERALER